MLASSQSRTRHAIIQTHRKIFSRHGRPLRRQGETQLQAILHARDLGTDVTPVWKKSNREHTLVGTEPASVLAEAESALAALGFDGSFHIDAAMRTRQHIGLTPAGFLVRSFSRPALQPSVAAALVLLGPRFDNHLRVLALMTV